MVESVVSSERAALIAAVCERPDDDNPRLAYADWLARNGEEDRAEFIRLQIAREHIACERPLRSGVNMGTIGGVPKGTRVASCAACPTCVDRGRSLNRELELRLRSGARWLTQALDGPADRWSPPLPEYAYRRGFVDKLSCSWAEWVDNGQHITHRAGWTSLCRMCRGLRLGDTVSAIRPNVLASGSRQYSHAIVVSLNPFTLVSIDGDMLWSTTQTADIVTRVVHGGNVDRAMRRWATIEGRRRGNRGRDKRNADDNCPGCCGTSREARTLTGFEHPISTVTVTTPPRWNANRDRATFDAWLLAADGFKMVSSVRRATWSNDVYSRQRGTDTPEEAVRQSTQLMSAEWPNVTFLRTTAYSEPTSLTSGEHDDV